MKRIIIQAGGDGKRWENYLCVKKHFIEIEGCTDIEELKNYPNIAHIDDWTEDFDYPHDFERWKERRKEK